MKFSCTQENLHTGLQVASHLAGKHVNLPILNNVLIKCDESGIHLVTTNLEVAVSCAIRGKVDVQGEFTVPSRLFADYIALLPKERVDVDLQDTILSVACGAYATKMNGITSQEFPLIPTVEDSYSFSISVQDLRKAIGQVQFSVAPNEARPEISGVLWKFVPSSTGCELLLAGTDSYRLAEKSLQVTAKKPLNSAISVIVPARTVSEVMRVLGVIKDGAEAPETVDVRIGESQIMFSYGPIDLISRIIEGKYPDYRQLIPSQFGTQVYVDRSELIRAVKTTSLFTRSGINDVALSFTGDGGLMMRAANSQTGEQTVQLSAKVVGQDNTLVVNFKYFLDGVQAMDSSQVGIFLNDSVSPCILKQANDEKELPEYLYIVMPIRQ